MTLDNNWFTEICEESGSAFSLKFGKKLHKEKTDYQTIEIFETDQFGTLMVIDGFVMFSDRDNFFYHEMLSHPALFTHSAPKKVLIIGGGDCGTLTEVLKHKNIEKVHQVEIDERVTRLAEEYFPQLCESNSDPRVQFHFTDGINWVKNSSDERYDIIIVDSTDPYGAAEGLFVEPFYLDCYRILSSNGLFVQQSESPLFHTTLLKRIYKAIRKVGYKDARTLHFPQCIYPSGWWTATMAGKNTCGTDQGLLSNFRKVDVQNKQFSTRYYNAEIHQAALAMPEYLKSIYA